MDKPAAAISVPAAGDQGAIAARVASGKRKRFKQNNLAGYLFVSPWLIGFLLFTMIPMAISLVLAFTDYDILGGAHFIGLQNFQHMFFADPSYLKSVSATFLYVMVSVPLRLLFAPGLP